jgi:hypothetical protein
MQVCTYRCITSYESKQLEEFSLCIIQKHNCFGLQADIPMVGTARVLLVVVVVVVVLQSMFAGMCCSQQPCFSWHPQCHCLPPA